MKNVQGILTATALALATFGTQLNASNTEMRVLTDNDWNQIEENVELENKLSLESIGTTKSISSSTLLVEFAPGNFTNTLHLQLSAPFATHQEVGIAVINANGQVVYSATGIFEKVKNLDFDLAEKKDMIYVVKIYSENAVYESKVQVAYL